MALEQSRGPLLYALSMYDFVALVPINPRAATAYRKSLHLSGAKDDPVDAALIRDFAAAHLDLVALIPTFILGCVLAYVYHRSNSVWPGVILHFLVNAFGLLAALVSTRLPLPV